jgi:hypothetical protein
VIGSTITTTFKDRLDLPLYSTDERISNAASKYPSFRPTPPHPALTNSQAGSTSAAIATTSSCLTRWSDSIPQLDWLALALQALCVVMFGSSTPSRGLNASVAVRPGSDVEGLVALWESVRSATEAGTQIHPYKPGK